MKRLLITGANGFLGRHLSVRLLADGWNVAGSVRRQEAVSHLVAGVEGTVVGEMGRHTLWRPALRHVDAVVHLAARAHIIGDRAPLEVYREVNVEGTERLLRSCAEEGVKRFVFVSSVKAAGEGGSKYVRPYREDDPPQPEDAYGTSKAEAEQRVASVAAALGVEFVIIRPPLVYGPGVRGNFARLIGLVNRGWPLPLGSVRNRRSMVYVGNLVDAISVSLRHPLASSVTFFVADHEVLSTPELICHIGRGLGRPVMLIPFPVSVLRLAGEALGVGSAVSRLVDSLEVDCGKIRQNLGWRPPFSCDEGIRKTVEVHPAGAKD